MTEVDVLSNHSIYQISLSIFIQYIFEKWGIKIERKSYPFQNRTLIYKKELYLRYKVFHDFKAIFVNHVCQQSEK